MLLFTEKEVRHVYRIPVVYTNRPLDIAFDTPLTDTFTINVECKGANIIREAFANKPIINIDVQKYYDESITEIQGEELRAIFEDKLNVDASEIKSYYPVSIPLKMSKLQQKEVDIIFEGEITTAQNNLVAEPIIINPEKVTVLGSEAQLEKITAIHTEYTEIKDIKKKNDVSMIVFKNGSRVNIPVSFYSLKNQYCRATMLKAKLYERTIKEM